MHINLSHEIKFEFGWLQGIGTSKKVYHDALVAAYITESPGHIFDMNDHYNKLNQFLKSCAAAENQDIVHDFFKGNAIPLPEEYVEHDEITDELLKTLEHDETVMTILKAVFVALHLIC